MFTRVLGNLWALPHTLFGLLLLLTVYFPKRIRWNTEGLDVVVRWNLIPKGMEPGFVTWAQTHGTITFYRGDEEYFLMNRAHLRLHRHERAHRLQCMRYGGILFPLLYGLDFLKGLLQGMKPYWAYHNIYFERKAREAEQDVL